MYTTTEQFAAIHQANVAQATKLAALAIESAEKVSRVNLLAAKAALAQGVETAQAAAAVTDIQQLFALRTKLAESGVDTTVSYSKSLYEITTEAQAQYSALAEAAWASYTKDVAAWVDKASKSAPAGSDVAVSAFRSTLAASTAAIDQINQATNQVVSLAHANLRAAAANAAKAATATKGRKAA
jgi:phasin family protein